MQINTLTLPLAWTLRQIGKRVRLRGWERLLRTLFHPDKQRRISFRIPFNNFVYPAYADSIVDWNALFYGTYETFELELLASIADCIEGAVFMDAGANVGHHSLFMSAHARHVHAYEPNPALWPLIEEKISVNGLKNITLHRYGLGSEKDSLSLYLSPECGESSLIAGANRTSSVNSVQVSIVRGDDHFADTGIGRLDVLKMDIEGFEKRALDGICSTLGKWRPFILVEISETGREQFGNFRDFIETFPERYTFYFCTLLKSGLIIRPALRLADGKTYDDFVGNVFCVPIEQEDPFVGLAGKTILRPAPSQVSDGRH